MKILAISVELAGIAIVAIGIGIEIAYEASIGLISITIGSMVIAIGGLVWAKMVPLLK